MNSKPVKRIWMSHNHRIIYILWWKELILHANRNMVSGKNVYYWRKQIKKQNYTITKNSLLSCPQLQTIMFQLLPSKQNIGKLFSSKKKLFLWLEQWTYISALFHYRMGYYLFSCQEKTFAKSQLLIKLLLKCCK